MEQALDCSSRTQARVTSVVKLSAIILAIGCLMMAGPDPLADLGGADYGQSVQGARCRLWWRLTNRMASLRVSGLRFILRLSPLGGVPLTLGAATWLGLD